MYYICARFLGPYGLSGAISASLILQNVLLAVAARRELGVSTMASASPGYYARSEEHTSELQSLMRYSYAVFCLKKKINNPPCTCILLHLYVRTHHSH